MEVGREKREDLEKNPPRKLKNGERLLLFVPPGGESFRGPILERVVPFWEELLSRQEERVSEINLLG